MYTFAEYRKEVWGEFWSRFWTGMARAALVCVPFAMWILVNGMSEDRSVIDGAFVVGTAYMTIVIVAVFASLSIVIRKWEREATMQAKRDALTAEWDDPTTGEG